LLGEKKDEVTEADHTLKQLENNYSNIRFTTLKMDISDQLEEHGASPLDCKFLTFDSHLFFLFWLIILI